MTNADIIARLGNDIDAAREWNATNEKYLSAAYALESENLPASDANVEALESLWSGRLVSHAAARLIGLRKRQGMGLPSGGSPALVAALVALRGDIREPVSLVSLAFDAVLHVRRSTSEPDTTDAIEHVERAFGLTSRETLSVMRLFDAVRAGSRAC